MPSFKGKCHCGHVEWTVILDDKPGHTICHCDTCKALSGSTFTLNTIVPKDKFKITKGTLSVYTYKGDSGNPVHCYYCPKCTVHIYQHQTVLGDNIVSRSGLLYGARDLPVKSEIYGKAKWSWEPEIAETHELLPPSF